MNHNDSNSINFVAHDSIDAIHQNQVAKLFEIAEKVHGQYIVSTLRKTVEFMGNEFITKNTILELSGESKFFRIEENNEQLLKENSRKNDATLSNA
jgi:thymidine kinase